MRHTASSGGRSLRGFTIIELVVSIGIMVTLMTTILANYPESNIRVNLALLAHTITLSLREAQLRGSSVESKDLSVGGYGVFFDVASSTHYALFNDFATVPGPNGLDVGDGIYATSSILSLDETVSTTYFPYQFRISKLCVGVGYPFSGANGSCNTDDSAGLPDVNTLTVDFIRPNPQPIITINQGDLSNIRSSTSSQMLSAACIEVDSESPNRARYVRSAQIFSSGMIAASKNGCQ